METAKALAAAEDDLEFYVKVTVPRQAAADWVRQVYEVDAADVEVLASVLASNLSLRGLISDSRFLGLLVKGGRK